MERLRRIVRRGMIDSMPFYGIMARRRALTLCIVAAVFFLLYSGPTMFRFVRRKAPFMMDSSLNSMLIELEDFEKDAASFDAQLHRSFDSEDVPMTSFVGNGYIGFDERTDKMLIFDENRRTLSVALQFSPIVFLDVDSKAADAHVTRVVHFTRGKFAKIESYKIAGSSATITARQDIFAHRTDPSVLVQSVTISNSGSSGSAEVIVRQRLDELEPWAKRTSVGVRDHLEYVQISGKVAIGQKFLVYSVITPKLGSKLSIEAKKSKHLELFTVIKYSRPVAVAEVVTAESKVSALAKKDFDRLMSKDVKTIHAEHMDAWQQIWRSGLSISLSRADNALNGDRINATLYYVLSHTPQSAPTNSDLPTLGKHCYKGHHTLNAKALWPTLAELGELSVLERTVHLWHLTLSKRGCGELVSFGGPRGAMQAMLMSFGAFFFHEGHLEFSTPPADLHRDFHYRQLMLFSGDSWLNVTVTVNAENKAVLAVTAKSTELVYACDGGCLDPPVIISDPTKMVEFPVKQTYPPTAVLYVARTQRHLVELKDTLHVHEVAEAPAHEKHVIALHRHGHQLGGLPALFWATFAFLVVVFHLFLARIIYNEYIAKGQYSPLDTNNKKYVA